MTGMLLRLATSVLGAALLSTSLQGCSFSSDGNTACNGVSCSCAVDLYSMVARLGVGGVPFEHASRHYIVNEVVKDVANGTTSGCCNAIRALIQADVNGKTADAAAKEQMCQQCKTSPNYEVTRAAAASCSGGATADALSALRAQLTSDIPIPRSNVALVRSLPILRSQATVKDAGQGPKYQSGQDCDIIAPQSLANLDIGGVPVSINTQLRVRWTDSESGTEGAPGKCCEALKPVLSSLYLERKKSTDLPEAMKVEFCSACRGSNNIGVALAAYRCWGNDTAVAREPPVYRESVLA